MREGPDRNAFSALHSREVSRKGATLVAALIAMLILSAVGLMISLTVAEDVRIAQNHIEAVRGLYIADAGLYYAIRKLEADFSWLGLSPPGRSLGAGYFTVAVSDSAADGSPLPPGQKRLNIKAFVNLTEKEIEVIVQ